MKRSRDRGEGCRTGPDLGAMYQLARRLIPTVDRFPRRQKFLLGDHIRTIGLVGTAKSRSGSPARTEAERPRSRESTRRKPGPDVAYGAEPVPISTVMKPRLFS